MAANGVMIVIFGFFLYNSIINYHLLLAVFLVTFAVYGLNKLTDKTEDSINLRSCELAASKHYPILLIASIFVGLLIGLLEGVFVCIFLFTPLIMGFVYSLKISKPIPRLKEILGVKSIVVALSWALTGAFLPSSFLKWDKPLVFFIYIFIKVFVGTILCDVLDIKGDSIAGIETIPTRLKKKKTKKLLFLLNNVGMLLMIYCTLTGIFAAFIPALLFGILYDYVAIFFFFKKNCRIQTARFMLDSEWLPIVTIAHFTTV